MNQSLVLVGTVAIACLAAACSSGPAPEPTVPPVGTTPVVVGNSPPDSGTGGGSKQDSGMTTTTNPDSGAPASEDSGPGSGSTAITEPTTWMPGQAFAGSVTINAGVTVTIAPGASVSFGDGATLTIAGTLTASSATGTHAALTGASGGSWDGVIVAQGGTLQIDGVDISGATTALTINGGNAGASYDDGTITGASTPFNLATGSTLTTDHATVTGTLGQSSISGALTATYLNYQKGPSSEGIVMNDPTATESFDNCTLTGSGPEGDFVVSQQGNSLTMTHTTISNVHCGFHFDAINSFDISYTVAENNAWGAMLYGSSPTGGPYSITNSNITNNSSYALDEEGTNGTITVDSCYIEGENMGISATNAQSSPVATAGPQ
jgi:hypothetical protein